MAGEIRKGRRWRHRNPVQMNWYRSNRELFSSTEAQARPLSLIEYHCNPPDFSTVKPFRTFIHHSHASRLPLTLFVVIPSEEYHSFANDIHSRGICRRSSAIMATKNPTWQDRPKDGRESRTAYPSPRRMSLATHPSLLGMTKENDLRSSMPLSSGEA